MKTSISSLSSAEICRQNGWGPGTELEGLAEDRVGDGPPIWRKERITISAIGIREILAWLSAVDRMPEEQVNERQWDLHSRDWEAVG